MGGGEFLLQPRHLGGVVGLLLGARQQLLQLGDLLLQLGRLARSGTTFAKQIEALLHLLAERGMSLPRTSEIAVALGLDATQEAQGKVGQAMLYLSKTGRIKRCTPSAGPYKGEAAVMLVDTGRIICSPLMPLSAVVFAP